MILKKITNRKSPWLLIAVIIFLFMILLRSTGFIVDYLWFTEVDYLQVFLKEIITKVEIGIPLFAVLTLILYIYFALIKALYNKKMSIFNSKIQNKVENRWVFLGSALLSLFLSLIITSNLWYKILEYRNSTDFNVNDPIFNKDMSFYVFKLPFFQQLYSIGLLILIILAIATFALFIILFALKGRQGVYTEEDNIKNINIKTISKDFISMASKQLSIVVGIFFMLLAGGFYLKTFTLLYSPTGIVYGAGYTDLNVTLWLYRISMVVSLIAGILIILAGYRRKIKLALVGPLALIVITLLGNIGAVAVENLIVSPNELVKEEPFIVNNIEYTQKAYGLDKIEKKDFPVEQNITAESIEKNDITINNIPINDYRPTTSMYNSLQGFRRYYEFRGMDVDRYYIDGQYTQVFLAARELNQDKIEESSKSWINLHLKYTHGFGAAVSPVNRVNEVGQPELILKDIPPTGSEDLKIDEPRIYFGELTNDYVITNTNTKEFDYPSGDDNEEYIYTGDGGIPMGFLNRMLFALNQGSLRIILSNDVNANSKILINRNIIDRVQKIAPFFEYDKDPYLVINEGKLYWIIDAFTTSDSYGYSQPFGTNSFNYIRNSVKVVIDAFNGKTTFYQIDREDPISTTYGKIYPDLLKDIEEMPEGIKDHIRYSQTLFDIQSDMYRTYHMENPTVFYNKEDLWQISKQIYGSGEEETIESTHIIMKDPDGEDEEFMLMVPYTPRDKDNMVSWMAALNDKDNYGKLVVYRFPKQKLVYGPMQVEKRIDQDTLIAKELTLLDQQGSNVIRGNLLTIPIDESLLFVEPIYLESSGGERNLPEVKRVIVAYENRIVMEESLEEALNIVFGKSQEEKPGEKPGEEPQSPGEEGPPLAEDETIEDLVQKANELFNKAEEAQRQGNWAEYGKYLSQLQDILKNLQGLVGTDLSEELEEGIGDGLL